MPINNFLLPGAKVTTGYDVANSCRFEYDNSEDLNKTLGTATNRKIFTISLWVKRSKLYVPGNETKYLVSAGDNASTNVDEFYFRIDTLDFSGYESSTTEFQLRSNAVFRDVSAWYNIVIAYDSTQGTASNRIKVYVNGTQVTSWSVETYPDENHEPLFNSAIEHHIGSNGDARFMDGYMAEVCFIDGTAYAASDFGEFDEDSPTIWKPKDVSGLTFGNNGFYLDFEDSGDLGDDESGNGNDFAENNLAAIDQATDTPTNNFATLNPLNSSSNDSHTPPTYSEGNLQSVSPSSSGGFVGSSTIGVSSGKWFFELQRSAGSSTNVYIGIGDEKATREVARQSSAAIYVGNQVYYKPDDGNKVIVTNASGVESSYGATYGNGDIIGIALNMDDNQVTFYKNGASQGTITIPTPDGACFLNIINGADTADTFQVNFGFPSFAISSGNADADGYGNFEYAVPSGYYALCTKNLGAYGG